MNEQVTERDIAIRAIEAYLTADKRIHRTPKATRILVALERLGYRPTAELKVLEPDEIIHALPHISPDNHAMYLLRQGAQAQLAANKGG